MPATSHPPTTTPRPARARPGLPAVLAFVVAVVLLAVLLVLPMVRAAREQRAEVLDTNAKLTVSQSAEVVGPGDRVCVRGLDADLRRVDIRVFPGYAGDRAPTLQVVVQDRRGAVLARGTATGYANGQPLAVPVDVGHSRRNATVCVRNAGGQNVTLAHAELPQAGRRRLPVRVDVTTRPFTTIERIPVALTRASLFKSDVVSRPLIVVLFGVVLALAAAAVVLVLRGLRGEDGDA